MKPLIECVPNFSEGRDASKVDALVQAMSGVPGAWVLASESDPDHNRSVVTLAGAPDAVAEAALRGVGKAAELIDLRRHSGAHPRIGAMDVLPFVPLAGFSMEDCVAMAHRVGQEIWDRYHIPVYFYEAAAMRPEREPLENLRQGEFEGLCEEVLRNPDRSPDMGEPRLHPSAGAIAVGARKLLIAYNVQLGTNDVLVARRIARAIRYSSGGLRHVKALGIALKSRDVAQVSINLTDFEQTPLHRVFEMVRREAEQQGCAVTGSEIVGLVPRRAVEMTSEFYLRLEHFSPSQVLETRLTEMQEKARPESRTRTATQSTLEELARPLLGAIAAPVAAPAGGSVAALAAAAAASLGEKVAELSRRKKIEADATPGLEAALEVLREAGRVLSADMDRDVQAYQAVLAARRLPKNTLDEAAGRAAALTKALRGATEVPAETALAAMNVFEQLVQLEAAAPASMLADLHAARFLAAAGARAALAVVAANLALLTSPDDAEFVAEMRSRALAMESRLAGGVLTRSK